MKNILLISLAAFAVACGSKADTEEGDTQQESQPTSPPTSEIEEPEPQEVMLYYTSMWNGEWTATDTELNGFERLQTSSSFQDSPGVRCDITWNMVGTIPETPACADCVFEFDIAATYSADDSDLDADGDGTEMCTDSATDATFGYAYTTDYQYNGESLGEALLYNGGEGFGSFVAPNSPNAPTDPAYSASISWDEASGAFSYSGGYVDYEYLYVY